jgi:hypothetical protein
MMKLSAERAILVRDYGGGDYSYMTDPREADDAMDTLFLFLMRELHPDGDTDRAEYIRRLEIAESEILTIRHALESGQ